jgi:hypothetical protein
MPPPTKKKCAQKKRPNVARKKKAKSGSQDRSPPPKNLFFKNITEKNTKFFQTFNITYKFFITKHKKKSTPTLSISPTEVFLTKNQKRLLTKHKKEKPTLSISLHSAACHSSASSPINVPKRRDFAPRGRVCAGTTRTVF